MKFGMFLVVKIKGKYNPSLAGMHGSGMMGMKGSGGKREIDCLRAFKRIYLTGVQRDVTG